MEEFKYEPFMKNTKKGDRIKFWHNKDLFFLGTLTSDAKYISTSYSGLWYADILWDNKEGESKQFCLNKNGIEIKHISDTNGKSNMDKM